MPLRSSRCVQALIATGIVASTVVLASLPAAASNVRDSEWWMTTLGIRSAWPVSRGQGVTVAVLSDGVDSLQPDLTGGVVTTGPDYTGAGQSSGQYFGEIGTGVAALIAGHGYGLDSQQGIAGIAPEAHILSVRVTLPPDDPMLADPTIAAGLPGAIADGIRYAVAHGASVIDLPIDPGQPGANGTGGASAAAGGSAAEAAAVKYALSRNVVLVAPAGDDNLAGDAPNYPAAYPGVIAVGAFNQDFAKAPWTSHQSYVTVTAAGSGMVVATNTGSFQAMSSTTYASAVVSAIVAMIQSRFPGISGTNVRKALITGTVFHGIGQSSGSGYGTVNAVDALTAAAALMPSTPAGAGAQPLSAPAAPAPQSPESGFVHSVVRAAVISAGLLVVLLLAVAGYAATGRRRSARQQEAVATGWNRETQSRYPRAGVTDSDRMLEFFAAPAGDPTGVAGLPLGSTGTLAGPAGADMAGAGLTLRGTDPFGSRNALYSWEVADQAGRSSLSPATRAVSKRPVVSGAPPWEDAARPDSELPWASSYAASMTGVPTAGAAADARAGADAERAAGAGAEPIDGIESGPGTGSASSAFGGLASALAGRIRTPGRHSGPSHVEPADSGTAALAQPTAPSLWDVPAAKSDTAGEAEELGPAPFSYLAGLHGSAQPSGTEASGQDWAATSYSAGVLEEPASRRDVRGPEAGTGDGWPGLSAPGHPAQALTGRLDWTRGPKAEAASPSDGSDFSQLQVPGGPLPVRQPRHTAPSAAPSAALSPSGSLWERAVDPAEAPAEAPAESPETGSRPMFTWNPTAGSEDYQGSSSSELAAEEAGWGLRPVDDRPAE